MTSNRLRLVATALALSSPALLSGCATRNYTYYLVEPETKERTSLQEEDTLQRPFVFGSTTMMKVRWNDGDVLTEVEVPMLSSGQRIVVEHGAANGAVPVLPATKLVPPPPTAADRGLVDAYRARGLRVDDSAAEISIVRARGGVQEALRNGNPALALEWVELVLARYPSHPEFLRAKASILLMMGEKAKAIEIYEQVENIESDPAVRKKLDELQSAAP